MTENEEFDKACADFQAEFGIDIKAEIESMGPLLSKRNTARAIPEWAARLRVRRARFQETGSLEEETPEEFPYYLLPLKP